MKNVLALLICFCLCGSAFAQDYWKRSEAGGKRMVMVNNQIWVAGDETLLLLDAEGNILEDLYAKHNLSFSRLFDLTGNNGKVALSTRNEVFLFNDPNNFDSFPGLYYSVCLGNQGELYAGNRSGLYQRVGSNFELLSGEYGVFDIEKHQNNIFIYTGSKRIPISIFNSGDYTNINIDSLALPFGHTPKIFDGVAGCFRISPKGTFISWGENYTLEWDGNKWDYIPQYLEKYVKLQCVEFTENRQFLANTRGDIVKIEGQDTLVFNRKDNVLIGHNIGFLSFKASDIIVRNGKCFVLDLESLYIGNSNIEPINENDHLFIDANNLIGRINYNGNLFLDLERGSAELKQKDSAAFVFSANLWAAAKTESGELRTAYELFNNDDVETPWQAGFYNDGFQFKTTSFVKVTEAEINAHKNNFGNTGYKMPLGIKNWPGTGNTSIGETELLAPYVDADGNGVYSPNGGDYPAIIGDQMIYIILNDSRPNPGQEAPKSIGLEMHVSVFAWDSPEPYLANTFFTNHRIINRSGVDYPEFKAGFWMDTDLGFPGDDYVGCDSINNIFYTYNGDDNDDKNGGSAPGFGLKPPAYGVKVLCDNLDGFMFYLLGKDPENPEDYYQLLNNRQIDSTVHTYNGMPTNYMFSGNPLTGEGDTEANNGNFPNDRRGLGTFPQRSFMAGETISYTLAHGYARKDNPANYLENIGELTKQLNQAEQFIMNLEGSIPSRWQGAYACNLVGINENSSNSETLNIYPNPNTGVFTVAASKSIESLVVYDITGKRIQTLKNINTQNTAVELGNNIPNGIYFVKITFTDGLSQSQKFSLNR